MDINEISMRIIVDAGDARSQAYTALAKAKQGNFEEAERLMKASTEKIQMAHHSHAELLALDCGDEKVDFSILLAHSMDHLMTAMLAQELIQEIIDLHKKMN